MMLCNFTVTCSGCGEVLPSVAAYVDHVTEKQEQNDPEHEAAFGKMVIGNPEVLLVEKGE